MAALMTSTLVPGSRAARSRSRYASMVSLFLSTG